MYEDRVKWIEYKGKRILELKYSGLPAAEIPDMFDVIFQKISNEEPNSVIYLMDASNMNFSMKTITLFNQFASKTKPFDKGVALLGATGLIKIMYDGFSKVFTKTLKTFDSREEALEWLVKSL
jgi:hypothetical protein